MEQLRDHKPNQQESEYSQEKHDTIDLAFQRHDETKETIAVELGLNSGEAERLTGEYFVAKVDADIEEGASHDEIFIDTDAAFISGVSQLHEDREPIDEWDFDFFDGDDTGKYDPEQVDTWLENPVAVLEARHPDIVTEAIADMATKGEGKKLAAITAKMVDWIKSLPKRLTPVFNMGTGTVMSLHTADKYDQFHQKVQAARQIDNPYNYVNHSHPTLDEFKEWKRTGEVHSGIEPYQNPFSSSFESPATSTYSPTSYIPPKMEVPQQSTEETYEWQGSSTPTPDYGPSSYIVKDYDAIERQYSDAIEINPVAATTEISPEDTAHRLELDRVVKVAPRLLEQIHESGRSNKVQYIAGATYALHTNTSHDDYRPSRSSMTEQKALQSLDHFLEGVVSRSKGTWTGETAASMRENLTFIGEKEYHEAVAGIAEYWKSQLNKNESLQILAVAGEIAKSGNYKNADGESQIKSDDFLLDHILSHFSEEDLEKYEGRLIIDARDITATEAADLKVVLLDDWTISGSQLTEARNEFIYQHPHLANSVEIQLIAGTEDRIKHGLRGYDDEGNITSTPIRSYFMAHAAESSLSTRSGAHITGFHSSVDFDFENDIGAMVAESRSQTGVGTMPPLTNIVRPYRYDGINRSSFVNRKRLDESVQRSRSKRRKDGSLNKIVMDEQG